MEHQLDATITVLLISKISSTCFGQTFANLQERKTEIFTACGIMSCKYGNTNIYVVHMWYVALVHVIIVSGCVLLCLGIIVVLYNKTTVCPKHAELILEINKTVIVASSWCSILLYLQ
jgi:hypothetical protein